VPTASKIAPPEFDLSTSAGGRGYIANLFKTQLKRHDFNTYINERLAADFACTLSRHLEDSKARELALQQRLNAADQRIDELTARQPEPDPERLMEIVEQYPNGDPLQYNAAVNALRKNAQ
jgi:hypothetical protein